MKFELIKYITNKIINFFFFGYLYIKFLFLSCKPFFWKTTTFSDYYWSLLINKKLTFLKKFFKK